MNTGAHKNVRFSFKIRKKINVIQASWPDASCFTAFEGLLGEDVGKAPPGLCGSQGGSRKWRSSFSGISVSLPSIKASCGGLCCPEALHPTAGTFVSCLGPHWPKRPVGAQPWLDVYLTGHFLLCPCVWIDPEARWPIFKFWFPKHNFSEPSLPYL